MQGDFALSRIFNWKQIAPIFLLPVVLGLLAVKICGLELKWMMASIIALIIVLVSFAATDRKRLILMLFIFFLPIDANVTFLGRPHMGQTGGLTISVCDILLVILYGLWIVELLGNPDRPIEFFPRVSVPILCLTGAALLSIVGSSDVALSVFEMVQILKMLLLFFYVANHVRNDQTLKYILAMLLVGLTLQSGIAFAQKGLGAELGLNFLGESELVKSTMGLGGVKRVGGTLGHPNAFAMWLELLLPLSIALVFSNIKMAFRSLCLLVFALGSVALVLTFSRGSWLGFGLSIAIVFILSLRKRMFEAKSVVLGLLTLLFLSSVILYYSSSIGSRILESEPEAAWARVPMMQVALSIIKANPVIGVGLNNYTVVMQAYDTTKERIAFVFPLPVHNIYLLAAAEMGLIGLFSLLWLLFAILRQAWLSAYSDNPLLSSVAIGLFGGLCAFFLHAMVNPAYLGEQPLLWFLIGVVAALNRIGSYEELSDRKCPAFNEHLDNFIVGASQANAG